MGQGTLTELRMYCICGQKMRVSESMFGLPGKCVACRQKIRVPFRDEIPPDTTEIHLKDHPEFLRKARPPAAPAGEGVRAEESAEVSLGEASTTPGLDTLDPLRVLCSLEHKIGRQLDALTTGEIEGVEASRAALEGHLKRVREGRAGLDEQLRQRLMEVAIELASTQEKTVQASLSARIGEMEFSAFRDTVDRLRHRREYLERLQQDLRAWLTVDDAHAAGGYTNVSFDAIPSEGVALVLPPEPFDPRTLFDIHIDGLREALLRRERAELRLKEVERLKREAAMTPEVVVDCRADCSAERLRAEAEVSFRRRRLEQVSSDCAADVRTIQACLDQARKRYGSGALDKAHFAAAEREMVRMQRDSARVHGLVARALMASNAEDVPHPSGSLIKRMVRPMVKERPGVALDTWIAWGSAFALGICVFLPLTSDVSLLGTLRGATSHGQAINWTLFIPVLCGAFATVIGALPGRAARGIGLALVWSVLTLVSALLVHESQYSMNPLAVWFRAGGPWFLRPGMVLLILADLGLLSAACLALAPLPTGRVPLGVVCATCLAVLLGVSSDFGGMLVPLPEISISENPRTAADGQMAYDTSVIVHNAGYRTLLLSSVHMDSRSAAGRQEAASVNAYEYLLEREVTPGFWQDTAPTRLRDVRGVPRGGNTVLRRELPPGNYRVRLIPSGRGGMYEKSFTLPRGSEMISDLPEAAAAKRPEAPAPEVRVGSAAPEAAELPVAAPQEPRPGGSEMIPDLRQTDEPRQANPVAAQTAPPPSAAVPLAEVELRGIVRGEKHGPRFSVAVYPLNAPARYLDLSIGDAVYDPWKITEFNPERQTVTVSDGAHLLILNRGERIPLK
jgi:hypothetical protein